MMILLVMKNMLQCLVKQGVNKDFSKPYYKYINNEEENKHEAYITKAIDTLVRTQINQPDIEDIYTCEVDISASIDKPGLKYKRLYRDSSYSTMQKFKNASKNTYNSPSPKKSSKPQNSTSKWYKGSYMGSSTKKKSTKKINKKLNYDFDEKRKSYVNDHERQASLSKNSRGKSLTKKDKNKYLNTKDNPKILSNLENDAIQYVKAFYERLWSKNNLSDLNISKSKSKALNDAENTGFKVT